MSLAGLVDYIKENLPSEAFAHLIEKDQGGRKFRVVSDNFIVSTSTMTGFVRVIRDIRMAGYPQIYGEINNCRVLYLYEAVGNDIFNCRTKYVFE